ncbi:helix-turn-helix domain-containing protein, partial [Phyllobacterium sophorae]
MRHRQVPRTEWQPRPLHLQAGAGEWPHAADLYVGRQVAAVRLQSDVTQAELARAVGISPQQLQKYENGKNRISASMLFEIATCLGVPVGRLFQGLPGNATQKGEVASLPVDERITFLASSEGRRLIEGVMRLHPRTRRRVSALIAALG